MDAEREVLAELQRIVDDQADVELARELCAVLAGADNLIARASEVMTMRLAKGKHLSPASMELLEWVHDGLWDLARVLVPEGAHDPGASQ
jgi:hypothetical protein